jgi:hypothetical protein
MRLFSFGPERQKKVTGRHRRLVASAQLCAALQTLGLADSETGGTIPAITTQPKKKLFSSQRQIT